MGDLGLIPGLGKIPWRRERLPTPVFWPGEFHRLYSPWGRKELDMTETNSTKFTFNYLILFDDLIDGIIFLISSLLYLLTP